MKAMTRHRFGPPDVLEFSTIPLPQPGSCHALVDVRAAGVNHGDALELRGWPYLARLMGYGIRRPSHRVIGTDIAGTVVATGPGVDSIDVGDEVVGWGTGAFAQIAAVPSSKLIRRPAGVSVEHAAATPSTAVAALQAIRDAGRVEDGQHVAITGASGGVGTFAVQLAKAFGAEVTGVCGTANVDLVRSLGADHVIDYRSDDVTERTGRFDAIIDLVGNQPLSHLRRALTPTGTLVVVGGQNPHSLTGMRRFVAAAARSPFTRQRLVPLFARPDMNDLAEVIDFIVSHTISPVVSTTFDLSDTAEAIRQVETGHSAGNVVITT